jgi:hypothetical protein
MISNRENKSTFQEPDGSEAWAGNGLVFSFYLESRFWPPTRLPLPTGNSEAVQFLALVNLLKSRS